MNGFAALEGYTEQAPVTAPGARLLLTLLVLALAGLVVWRMLASWRRRAQRQSWVVRPDGPPSGFTPSSSYPARYVASVETRDWLQRIAADGLGMPGRATIGVAPEGVLVARVGEPDLYLPVGVITAVDTARGIAQEVYEREGLLVITWRSGTGSVTTGLRLDSAAEHLALLRDLEALIGGSAPAVGEGTEL